MAKEEVVGKLPNTGSSTKQSHLRWEQEEATVAKEKTRNKKLGGEEEARLERCERMRKHQGPPGVR